MEAEACQQLCLVIGDPIAQSLSPAMHSAGFAACGISDKFVFAPAHVRASELEKAVQGMRAFAIRGMSVTIPHKQSIIPLLDELDPLAAQAGAVNTVVNDQGVLRGLNTDCYGILNPLESQENLEGASCVVLGAGGASRAAIAALLSRGARVTVLNRSEERLKSLSEVFPILTGSLDATEVFETARVIINTTPLGMAGDSRLPIDPAVLQESHIVFDTVYTPYWTPLLQAAHGVGASCIHGIDMFVAQGAKQFSLYTGENAPEAVFRKVVQERLGVIE